jgi:hypothetical protein
LTEDGSPTDILEIYDPRTDAWSVGASLPKAISAYALADFEGQLYLFGGWDGEQALADVYIYDLVDDAWREGTEMTVARYDAGVVSLADQIVVMGGRNEGGALKEAQAYYPSRDGNGESPWEAFPDLPEPMYGFGVASVSESIFIIGGLIATTPDSEKVTGIQYVGNAWQLFKSEMKTEIFNWTLIVIESEIFILSNDLMIVDQSALWSYTAFYYEIFIPIIN